MLEVNNIEVVYNDVILVLKGISLSVPQGGVVALLGGNGAGKTTTLKAISGLLRLQNGEMEGGTISFGDRQIQDDDPDRIVRMGISMVPEGRRIFSDLSVMENLMIGAFIRSDRKAVAQDLEMVMDYFPVLRTRANQRAIYLSGGEQQMVAVGRALMARPRLIMLDEPSLGLAPLVVKNIFQILLRINQEQGTTLLLVEQNANLALNFASYGYIMENGRIVLDGPCDQLRQNEDVQEFYLGVTDQAGRKSYADVKHYKRRKRWLS
ncbi:MAG: ABC transporter ATP-binding protein [Proteobacteria bacterium]|nr:ABC transporter ATP-binding protein [Pseudomonadota bacterium]MBU1451620.1 ABC transporter ATP-binding protein [Pseudomonadota bacterium]MBU2469283.1 ABC transporter ATP-binding protein [Pseudomonadota bacterium]MBU2517993.1 ABC transporter ATP-binding protein [Pseudomonadota bacterium]